MKEAAKLRLDLGSEVSRVWSSFTGHALCSTASERASQHSAPVLNTRVKSYAPAEASPVSFPKTKIRSRPRG
jgi:hypothetical protein